MPRVMKGKTMDWPYAELSHNAKEAGGPEAYVKKIEDAARVDGIKTGAIGGAVATGASCGFLWLVNYLWDRYQSKKAAEAEEAKAQLMCKETATMALGDEDNDELPDEDTPTIVWCHSSKSPADESEYTKD